MNTLLTIFSALLVGFFGGRFIDRYKRAVDRRDELTQAADDVLDAVARLHEAERSPTRQELERVHELGNHMRRISSRYLDGRASSGFQRGPRGEALFGRLGRLPLTSHGRYSDAAIMRVLHYDLRFTLRDLPRRIDSYFTELESQEPVSALLPPLDMEDVMLEVHSCARSALAIRDAATGRARRRNRGMNGRTRQYLFNQGRLPNLGLLQRSGAVEIDEW